MGKKKKILIPIFGVQFVKMTNEDKEIFISNIADYASSNISDIYFR